MMASDGEYSSLLLAQEILHRYAALDRTGRVAFFNTLKSDYDVDVTELLSAVSSYQAQDTFDSLNQLTKSSEPKRQELLRRLNMPDAVTPALVKMREDLLDICKERPELAKIDADFRHLFRSWFNRGFLEMRQLDWHTPASILEKIVSYEAVHAISNMEELRARLAPSDRFCFAFFHPAMLDEPLVFLEVALTQDMPNNINDILSPQDQAVRPEEASCAIFYSISNCHRGLNGVSFGNLLIKQVVAALTAQFPQLKTFATLSPVPGFRRWLDKKQQSSEKTDNNADQESSDALLKLAAEYFLSAKNVDGKPLDPVARFHLNNGAQLERINLDSDVSDKGMAQAYGVMVNYVYSLNTVTENHENYVRDGKIAVARW